MQDQNAVNRYMNEAKGQGAGESPFLKLPAGIHRLRVLPMANQLENLHFRKNVQHAVQDGTGRTTFVLCWDYIGQNPQLVGRPLAQEGKLGQQDMLKYRDHGCPFCRAAQFLQQAGVDKKTISILWGKDSYLFSVLWRGDGKTHIWNASTRQWKNVMQMIEQYQQAGIDALDPNTGFDLSLTAEGEGQNRRYPVVNFFPQACPINLMQGVKQYNLIEIANMCFKSYQETIDILKNRMGQLFLQLGYTIPGDTGGTQLGHTPNVFPTPQNNTPQGVSPYGYPMPEPRNAPMNPSQQMVGGTPVGFPVQPNPQVMPYQPVPVQPNEYSNNLNPQTYGQVPAQNQGQQMSTPWMGQQPSAPTQNVIFEQPQQYPTPTPGMIPQQQPMWNQGQAVQSQGTFPTEPVPQQTQQIPGTPPGYKIGDETVVENGRLLDKYTKTVLL